MVVNENSKTIHSVILSTDVYTTGCAWSFQHRARLVRADALRGRSDLFTCGICFCARQPFQALRFPRVLRGGSLFIDLLTFDGRDARCGWIPMSNAIAFQAVNQLALLCYKTTASIT